MYLNEIIEIIQKAMEAVPWLFSGIGLSIVSYIYKTIHKNNTKKSLNQSKIHHLIARQNTYQPETLKIEETYEFGLGKRLICLREVLGFNQNQMRKVLGYTKVSELREYEKGKDEFPQESIDKVEKIFSINRSFLEDGDTNRIFQTFDVYPEKIRELLKDNFEIDFLCCPYNRKSLDTYPVFFKQEGDYARLVIAKPSCFMSGGGGKQYIERFIKEMLHKRMNYSDAFVLKVDWRTWQQLEQGTFYHKNLYFGLGQDYECKDIFDKWFQNLEEKMYPERNAILKQFSDSVYGSNN